MNSRPFEPADLPQIATWFADIEWPLPPIADMLPKIGAVAEKDGKLLACGWLYTTGTSLAFLSWTATNPDEDIALQGEAMESVIASLQEAVKYQSEIKMIMVLSKSDAFLTRLKKLNFRAKRGFDLCTWITRD